MFVPDWAIHIESRTTVLMTWSKELRTVKNAHNIYEVWSNTKLNMSLFGTLYAIETRSDFPVVRMLHPAGALKTTLTTVFLSANGRFPGLQISTCLETELYWDSSFYDTLLYSSTELRILPDIRHEFRGTIFLHYSHKRTPYRCLPSFVRFEHTSLSLNSFSTLI